MQYLIVRKSTWRRYIDACCSHHEARWSIKVKNKSSKWVRVITVDNANESLWAMSNYCGMAVGAHTRYYFGNAIAPQVQIEIPGAANLIIAWDLDRYTELVLFDDNEE